MERAGSTSFFRKLLTLTIGGGLVFWAATVAISLLPLAAEYRAAYSNWSIQSVWVGSLFAGLAMGCCVSYALLRLLGRNPAGDTTRTSLLLGLIALVVSTLLIDVPRSLLSSGPGDAWHYFLVGLTLNVPRFLLLGRAIGYLHRRLYGSA